MKPAWRVTQKPSFLTELLGLPPRESHQVLEKIALLVQDPTPDGKVRVALKGLESVCRLRCGDYRILYTYKEPYVSLLSLRRRNEGTYADNIAAEFLGGLDSDVTGKTQGQPDWERILAPKKAQATPLPERITTELLERLRVANSWHKTLCAVKTREALFDCPGVADEIKIRLDDYLFGRPIEDVVLQPDLVAQDVSDLLRFKEGSLLAFLLKLDPEQEKFVTWAIEAKGPTLVKGGPGTGKSTVALYRCRSLLRALPRTPAPRLLFTTYTNALVAFSKQLLEQLLGEDASLVEVRTADSLAKGLTSSVSLKIVTKSDERSAMKEAIQSVVFPGNALERLAQRDTIQRLGPEYVLEEIGSVIEARGFSRVEEYLSAPRPGRSVGLNATQRRAVWTLRERLNAVFEDRGVWTWHQMRRRAAEVVATGRGVKPYDAVVVDEAQDLPVSTLRMLVGLCATPNRFFITADANQSIYGSGFRWTDVHESLSFRGRTGVLRTNYRSTEQIGRAAASYLGQGGIEPPEDEDKFAHTGPPPAVRAVASKKDEIALLARFLPGAAREFRFGLGSCAVLVPFEETGYRIAGGLSERGVEAEFMPGKDLELKRPLVKVMTLKSAKGLEFPIVAVAGFVGSTYPVVPVDSAAEAADDIVSVERRTIYVAMTRAMRGLLVVTPAIVETPLLKGFDKAVWNLGGARQE